MNKELDQFLDLLLSEKKIELEDEEVRKEVKEDMASRLLDQIYRSVFDGLSDEDATELSAKIDEPDFMPDDAIQFAADHGVDVQAITVATMLQFRSFYLGADLLAELEGDRENFAAAAGVAEA